MAFQCYNNYLDKNGFKGEQKQLQLKRYFYAYAQEYRSKYTRRYVDFIAFGIGRENGPDVHSMNKERVNGIVSNCDAWYNTFNITSGKEKNIPNSQRAGDIFCYSLFVVSYSLLTLHSSLFVIH